MPLLIKSTYVYIFTATIIFGTYGWWVFGVLGIDYFTGPDALLRIGKAISILIVAGYAFELLVLFAAGVFSVKVLKKPVAEFTLDERDKEIVYKSMYYSHMVLCIGLCLSVFAMAWGVEIFWVFNLIVIAFLLSVVTELATKYTLFKAGT